VDLVVLYKHKNFNFFIETCVQSEVRTKNKVLLFYDEHLKLNKEPLAISCREGVVVGTVFVKCL
jgi:hypothetical protein